jgi:hypothetical protein
MDNANATAHGEELPQHLLEAIHKLVQAGASHQVISLVLGLTPEVVQQVLANDPLQVAKLTESIREKSKKYRCVLSNRLMTSPVIAPDGYYYEQLCLEAHPSISSERAVLNPRKKARISEFCRESLKELTAHLRQEGPSDDILELSVECLAVLNIETETDTFLRVLGAVEGETMTKLSERLRHLVREEDLITLMHRSTAELPTLALCLAKLFMLEPRSEIAFEEAFRCFTELLSQAALSAGAIDLAEQVSERLNSTLLGQMNQALKTQPREEEVELRLERLRLKEAYLRLREGDRETAVRLVSTLHLEREVLEFYEEAGMNSGRISVLKHKLSTALELVGRESPSFAAALDTFQQLSNAELKALSSGGVTQQALSNLRGEVGALREDHAQLANECKQALLAQDAMLHGFQEISERTEANLQTLNSLRGEVLKLNTELAETKHLLQDTREALYNLQATQLNQDILPTFIYSYKVGTDQLHRTSLVTGEQSSHQVPSYRFKRGCCWSEVPGGSLLITGGSGERGDAAVNEAVSIDVGTFEVSPKPHMHTQRKEHAAVYHTQHLYVLGGLGKRCLSECERYVCEENRWEALPSFPRPCSNTSGVVLERNLYALGGYNGFPIDWVQKLSLESLTWELMQLRLPHTGWGIPCFKLRNTEVYLVVNMTLYSFTALQVLPLKTLPVNMRSWCGASYYHRGTLYSSSDFGAVRIYEIGSFSN